MPGVKINKAINFMRDSFKRLFSSFKVEWLHNGHPLGASSRHRLMNDFGFVSLDIHYIIEEDAGTYTLVVSNPAG